MIRLGFVVLFIFNCVQEYVNFFERRKYYLQGYDIYKVNCELNCF